MMTNVDSHFKVKIFSDLLIQYQLWTAFSILRKKLLKYKYNNYIILTIINETITIYQLIKLYIASII